MTKPISKIDELISKTERSLKAARRQIEEEDYDFAVSRIYYAMFYITEAVLLTKNLSTSKHSGLIAIFNQHFIKTGIFDKKYYRLLNDAFDLRQMGDYFSDSCVTKEVAENLEKQAQIYIGSLQDYLRGRSSANG